MCDFVVIIYYRNLERICGCNKTLFPSENIFKYSNRLFVTQYKQSRSKAQNKGSVSTDSYSSYSDSMKLNCQTPKGPRASFSAISHMKVL